MPIDRFQTLDLDTPTIDRLSNLHPDLAERLLRVYVHMFLEHGLTMRCTEGVRDFNRQASLYAQGRTTPGDIVTNAKPGESIHHYGLAADSCFKGNDPYMNKTKNGELYWRAFGNFCRIEEIEWGGDFQSIKDMPHAQKTYGFSVSEMKSMYQQDGFTTLWKAITARCKIVQHPS